MAKKKRSAKQLANDKRLGRMAKARAKKKRAQKKTAKKRPVRRRTTRVTKKAARRTRRKTKTRTTDYVVFRCVPGRSNVMYLKAISPTGNTVAWTGERYEALHWTKKTVAAKWARKLSANRRTVVGVAGSDDSKTDIARTCAGKA